MYPKQPSLRRNFGAIEDGTGPHTYLMCLCPWTICWVLGWCRRKRRKRHQRGLLLQRNRVWHMRQGNANSYFSTAQYCYPVRKRAERYRKTLVLASWRCCHCKNTWSKNLMFFLEMPLWCYSELFPTLPVHIRLYKHLSLWVSNLQKAKVILPIGLLVEIYFLSAPRNLVEPLLFLSQVRKLRVNGG